MSEHIPVAIQSLLSPNLIERHEARFSIDNEAVRQSDRYEAAAYVIATLSECLASNPVYGREEIYEILIEIAAGSDMPNEFVKLKSGSEIPLAEACKSELERFRDVFEQGMDDSDYGYLARELVEVMNDPD